MAGYFIYSLDGEKFQQLVTNPSPEQGLILADALLQNLDDILSEIDEDDEDAADLKKWPADRDKLAASIIIRLAKPDWYSDLTMGDAAVLDSIVHSLTDEPGQQIGIDFRAENDGFLYWDAAGIAYKKGAKMMREPLFGNYGFRYSGKAKSDLDLMYTLYLPAQVQQLLKQLESVRPHFETLPDEPDGDRDQFF
jgi:hypothetical protein